MSTIVDEPTYPYSKKLVEALNQVIPEALARPARAKNFERVHSLFKTKQLHLVLLLKVTQRHCSKGAVRFQTLVLLMSGHYMLLEICFCLSNLIFRTVMYGFWPMHSKKYIAVCLEP